MWPLRPRPPPTVTFIREVSLIKLLVVPLKVGNLFEWKEGRSDGTWKLAPRNVPWPLQSCNSFGMKMTIILSLIWARQRFLAIIVGEGPEAAAKAADLAQKFEQHVYSSTTTKVN